MRRLLWMYDAERWKSERDGRDENAANAVTALIKTTEDAISRMFVSMLCGRIALRIAIGVGDRIGLLGKVAHLRRRDRRKRLKQEKRGDNDRSARDMHELSKRICRNPPQRHESTSCHACFGSRPNFEPQELVIEIRRLSESFSVTVARWTHYQWNSRGRSRHLQRREATAWPTSTFFASTG